MPRYPRRHRKRSARKGRKKAKASKKFNYTSKIPRSIKGYKQLSFPAILKRTLRVSYVMTITPVFDDTVQRWVGVLNFLANGVMAPLVTPTGVVDPRVPMGLDNYAKVYSSYRVNSSKMHLRCFASPLAEDYAARLIPDPAGGDDIQINTGPAYITARRRDSENDEADMAEFSLATCKENGWRFLKIDPSQTNGPAPAAWSGIGGRDYAHVQNGSSISVGYKAKYAKKFASSVTGLSHRITLDPHNSSITGNPSTLQYFQILIVNPDENQIGPTALLPPRLGRLQPTPVQCHVTILYNMSFWRSRTLKPKSTVSEVQLAAAAGGLA